VTAAVDLRPAASPLAVYANALRAALGGAPEGLTAVDSAGGERVFLPTDWCRPGIDGDEGLLRRCAGPTLDVGCGPGRLAGALAARGLVALGVDVSREAVRLARRRGVRAVCRSVFDRLPGEGRWHRVVLADGNIGIAGDPARLLQRCRDLAAPEGRILVESDPPGAPTWVGDLRIRAGRGAPSAPFAWAYVGADDLAALAAAAGLRVLTRWTEAGRWFASLARR
jgi:SAM-dependent methyltransferase